ncbi:putative ATP/GTP-binding protein [Hydrogenimonas sp.]|nr:putative ATP/GTP-binding protein [Hydrogenimonas sp.]
MTQLGSLTATANTFSFDLTTSSGDRISLSLYDNRSVSMQMSQDGSSKSFSMSLKHEYGYSFSYSGNGIDARDRAEIEEAMKVVKPLFQEFLQNVKESGEAAGVKETANTAQLMKSLMPESGNEDAVNLLKSRTVDMMDEVLSSFEKSRALIESSKKLFDRLFESMKSFEIYA